MGAAGSGGTEGGGAQKCCHPPPKPGMTARGVPGGNYPRWRLRGRGRGRLAAAADCFLHLPTQARLCRVG